MKLRTWIIFVALLAVSTIIVANVSHVQAATPTERVNVRYHPTRVIATGFVGPHYVAQCNMNYGRDGLGACSPKEWAEPIGNFTLPWTPIAGHVGNHGGWCDQETSCFIGVFNVDEFGRPVADGAIFHLVVTGNP